MRIEKNGVVEKIIREDSISPVCDDRIISFGNLLNEFKKQIQKIYAI